MTTRTRATRGLIAALLCAGACASAGARAADAGVGADAPTAARAPAAFSLSARVEPDPVDFGGRFELVVEVVRGRGERLDVPGELPETKSARRTGEVARSIEDLPAPGEGAAPSARVKEIVRVPYLALDLDEVKTPAFVIRAPDGSPLEVPELPVRVKAAAPPTPPGGAADPAQPSLALEPAKDHLLYGVLDARPLVVLGALLSSALSFAALVFISRRRRLSRAIVPSAAPRTPARPAHEIALERLERLLAEGFLQRGEARPFVARLMDEVLRDYLEARFSVPAGKRTTRELAEDLLARSAPGLDVALVRALLEDADLVKFARADVAVDAAHAMAGRVRGLVEATAERPAPAAQQAQAEEVRA